MKLRGASGVVEASEMAADAGTWAFQLVVTSNAVLTTATTLHFDVLTPDGPQQGEINLTIRPRNGKLWLLALTAGAAVTVKGLTAVVPALLKPGDPLDALHELMSRSNGALELAQLASVPVIRALLGVVDLVNRSAFEG